MDWEVGAGEYPVPVEKKSGKSYHSRHNPHLEAERWLAAPEAQPAGAPALAVVVGVGFGYHLEVIRKRFPKLPIIAVEPDPELLALAWRVRGAGLAPVGTTIAPVTGDDAELAGEAVRRAGGAGGLWLLATPAAQVFHLSAVQTFLRELNRALEQDLTSLRTGVRFAQEWLEHTLHNLPLVIESQAAGSVRLDGAPAPAVIVGAGPSLDAELAALRALRGRAAIVAVDTALTPLLDAGVTPDFVVSVDSQAENLDHFTARGLTIPLVYDPAVHPRIRDHFAGKHYAGDTGSPLVRFLAWRLGSLANWLPGGTVVSIAYQFARDLGCAPLVFSGADFSYADGKRYAVGTRAHRQIVAAAGRFAPPETADRRTPVDGCGAPTDGEPPTSDLFRQYADWLNRRIRADGIAAFKSASTGRLELPVRPLKELAIGPARQFRWRSERVSWSRDKVGAVLKGIAEELADLSAAVAAADRAGLLVLARRPVQQILAALVAVESRELERDLPGAVDRYRDRLQDTIAWLNKRLEKE